MKRCNMPVIKTKDIYAARPYKVMFFLMIKWFKGHFLHTVPLRRTCNQELLEQHLVQRMEPFVGYSILLDLVEALVEGSVL